MTRHTILAAGGLWCALIALALAACQLWSSAGYAAIDGAAVAYAARWVG